MGFIWPIILFFIFIIPFISFVLTPFLYYVIWSSLLVFLLAVFILKHRLPRSKNIAISILLFLAYLIIPTIFSKDPSHSTHQLFEFCVCISAFLVFSRVDIKKKRLVSSIIILGSLFIALYAIYQHYVGFELIQKSITENKIILPAFSEGIVLKALKRGRIMSVFTTANLLSAYLVTVSLMAFGYMLDMHQLKRYFLLLPVLLVNLCAIYFTYTASGVLSLCFGFIIFISLCLLKNPSTIKKHKLELILVATLIVIISISVVVLRGTNLCYSHYLQNLWESLHGRFRAWQFLVSGLATDPFRFLGLGNYELYPDNIYSVFVHNIFLQLWIEAGIAGLMIFIWFIGSLLIRGLRNLQRSKDKYFLDIGLTSAVSAFLFGELAGYSFFIGQVSLIWWILCGLLIAES